MKNKNNTPTTLQDEFLRQRGMLPIKQTRQFNSIEAIEFFLVEANNGTLDNIWENIQDEYDAYTNEEEQVQAFNQAIRDMAELIS